jgi:26S proteasome regulatory subunit N6
MAFGESSKAPPPPQASARVQEAQRLMATDPAGAERIYSDIVASQPSVTSEAAIREYEAALLALGARYRDEK